MGTDFQRTVLWVFFGMSLFLLWDRWLVYNGKPSMFGTTPTAQAPASAEQPKAASASAVPGAPYRPLRRRPSPS
jgi:YidC/Oxa1 family membrane protein insertase